VKRPLLIALFFSATFLQAGPYGLTFVLPPLFAGFNGNEADVGNTLALTAISTLFIVMFSGHVTDRLGRMPTIAWSGGVIALSLFLFATAAGTGVQIYLAGILLGVGWGLFYTLTPVALGQIIKPEERVRFFTLLSVFIMAGFGLAPVMGSWVERIGLGLQAAFMITAGFCLVSGLIFAALARPFRHHIVAPVPAGQSDELSFGLAARVMRTRAAVPIWMVGLGASVFAGVTNFQAVYAAESGFDYADYFLTYTITVIACRVLFAEFVGGRNSYGVISLLMVVMALSVGLFLVLGDSGWLYLLAATLFGIGYGVSYPIVKAMAANEAQADLMPQTMQLFGLSYFIGVFGFPFAAGWIIVTAGIFALLMVSLGLALAETVLATGRFLGSRLSSAREGSRSSH
jgi:MFS family permease